MHFVHVDQALINHVPALHHGPSIGHIFITELFELVILTSITSIGGLSQHHLTELIHKECLAPAQQTDQRRHCNALTVQELLQIHFFIDARLGAFNQLEVLLGPIATARVAVDLKPTFLFYFGARIEVAPHRLRQILAAQCFQVDLASSGDLCRFTVLSLTNGRLIQFYSCAESIVCFVVAVIVIQRLTVVFETEERRHQRTVHKVLTEGQREQFANHEQGEEEPTKVTEPVEQAVGVPVVLDDVQGEVDLNRHELVAPAWLLIGRVVDPGAGDRLRQV